MNENKEVIFYGPLGISRSSIGGGESGNKKTITVLEKSGFKIHILEKPYLFTIPILSSIIAPFQFFHKMLLLILRANSIYSKAKIFHLSGFYCNLIFFEFLFVSLAKRLHFKTIYEIRAGGMISAYQQRSNLYRRIFKCTILKSDRVLCQGIEYCSFLEESFSITSTYYPNFIQNNFVSKINFTDERLVDDTMQIVFLGRITPSKRIDLIIEIGNRLKENNIKFFIHLIGNGVPYFENQMKEKCRQFEITDRVCFYGKMNEKEISKLLLSQHFFIFPSNEKREGHSNSLTEAMNFGVVPIASNIGFNKTIINNSELIIEDFKSENYAAKMIELFSNRTTWKKFSDEMHKRIGDFYTESIISKTLLSVYNEL